MTHHFTVTLNLEVEGETRAQAKDALVRKLILPLTDRRGLPQGIDFAMKDCLTIHEPK
jgi:hypothetical protein